MQTWDLLAFCFIKQVSASHDGCCWDLQVLVGGGQDAADVTTTSDRAGGFQSRFFHKVQTGLPHVIDAATAKETDCVYLALLSTLPSLSSRACKISSHKWSC